MEAADRKWSINSINAEHVVVVSGKFPYDAFALLITVRTVIDQKYACTYTRRPAGVSGREANKVETLKGPVISIRQLRPVKPSLLRLETFVVGIFRTRITGIGTPPLKAIE